jgi:hypothetical protein
MNTNDSSQQGHDSAPLYLVVGVTGHCDPRQDDVPTLKETVRGAFERIRKECPDTPLLLLTSLAEGADRLVAHVALHMGCRLIPILPMPPAVYEEIFADAESRDDFRRLMQHAMYSLDISQGRIVIAPGADEATRTKGYALAGAFIAQHSQVLLALWDGEASDKEGGTAQVVWFAQEGVPDSLARWLTTPPGGDTPFNSLDEPKRRAVVYHIPTARVSKPQILAGSPKDLELLYPNHDRELTVVRERYARIFLRISQLNGDSRSVTPPGSLDGVERKCALLPNESARNLSSDLASIDDHYGLADTLAGKYQGRTRFVQLGLMILVLASAIALSLYSNVQPLQHPRTAMVYLAGLVLASVFWFIFTGRRAEHQEASWTERILAASLSWIEQRDYQNKHLDYRALAEGLRVQFYWRLSGLEDRVLDHYLTKYRTELDWIRATMRNWDLMEHRPVDSRNFQPTASDAGQLDHVLTYWVKGQRDYFRRRAREEKRKLVRWEGLVRWFVGLGIAIIVVSMVLLPRLHDPWSPGLLLVAAALAPVIAALIHNDAETQALSQHINQYERMSAIFNTASNQIEQRLKKNEFQGVRDLLKELGKEALIEHADWVLLHRERLLEVPRA